MEKKRIGPRWLTETELKKALDDLYVGLTDEEESIFFYLLRMKKEVVSYVLAILSYLYDFETS